MPSWLLTGYSLVLDGEATVCGRPGVRVLGTPRTVTKPANRFGRLGKQAGGGMFAPPARWLRLDPSDEVEAVVDAELGILLRCAKRTGDGLPEVTEFTSLDVGAAADAALFAPPAGSAFGGGQGSATWGRGGRPDGPAAGSLGDALGEALGTAGKEAAKAVAGIAAGGLGALIRYAPKPRIDPFAQATSEAADPEAAMPADEQPPDETAEGLRRGARRGAAPPVPQRACPAAGARDAASVGRPRPGPQRGPAVGAGHRLRRGRLPGRRRTRCHAGRRAGAHHAVCTVAMGGWNEYRIDVIRSIWDVRATRRARPGLGHAAHDRQ